MRKNLIFKAAFTMVAAIAFASCSTGESDTEVDGVPFKSADDSNWGMIAPDGKVIFQDEFKGEPTASVDNRFFVETSDGVYEMYETAKKPKKIGGEYVSVTTFNDDRAIVAEKSKPLTIIDTDAKVIKTLDKVGGKTVEAAERFFGGTAIVHTADTLCGAVDKNGEMVIKPTYSALSHYGYNKFIAIKGDKKMAIDSKGEELFSLTKYENVLSFKEAEYLAVATEHDGELAWGIIDAKGESVVRPSDKYKSIISIYYDKTFIYQGADGYGLMSIEGESLIRAKYDYLTYIGDGLLAAYSGKKCQLINENGEKVSEEEFESIGNYLDGTHAFAAVGEKEVIVIDKEGKEVKDKEIPDIKEIGNYTYNGVYAFSDYLDIDGILDAINFNADGVYGFTTKSTAAAIAQAFAKAVGKTADPSNYAYVSQLGDDTMTGQAETNITYGFESQIAEPEYQYDDWGYSYPTGNYHWCNVSPTWFSFRIKSRNDRIANNVKNILKAAIDRFKKYGKVTKQKDNAALLSLSNGSKALVFIDNNDVCAIWGKASEENFEAAYNNLDNETAPDVDYDDGADSCAPTDYDY